MRALVMVCPPPFGGGRTVVSRSRARDRLLKCVFNNPSMRAESRSGPEPMGKLWGAFCGPGGRPQTPRTSSGAAGDQISPSRGSGRRGGGRGTRGHGRRPVPALSRPRSRNHRFSVAAGWSRPWARRQLPVKATGPCDREGVRNGHRARSTRFRSRMPVPSGGEPGSATPSCGADRRRAWRPASTAPRPPR